MSFHARDLANLTEADRIAFLATLTPAEAAHARAILLQS
jgi:hypothetical protein